MWSSFCELALFGGPPHRGPESALVALTDGGRAKDGSAVEEIRRGIWETTGLYAEPAAPGWLAVTCDSPRMAAWLCATIILENVAARCDEERLLVPADPGFTLEDQVKSVITVVAKTHHYWSAHVAGS
jgi:sirohydrochlorin cobaltochelatase